MRPLASRQIDTRLIQTAVIGGRDSDQPVILPEEPHNFDQFLRRFGRDDFWCGTLLGGCGEPLHPKRYVTKVCHFSHGADPGRGECHRTTHSADGADHLFIKAHATRWLATQGHAAHGELRTFGHCHGDAVDFRLPASDMFLRFELHSEDYRSWRKAADSLGAKEGRIEWVFGRDDVLAHDMVARRGYALLVRCETEGNDRRVFIGTLTDGRKPAWDPLEQCRMTGKGLVTPALESLRAKGTIRDAGFDAEPLPAGLPMPSGKIVFAVDTEAVPPATSPLLTPGRYLVPGFVKPAGSRIVRAHLSLPDSVPAPTEQYVYRLAGSVRLLVTDVVEGYGSPWAFRADSLTELNGLDAERTGLWRPSVALDDKHVPAPRAAATGERPALPEPAPSVPGVPETAPAERVDVLRRLLETVAAKGTTITWSELIARLGPWVHDLSDPQRQDLLVAVDKSRGPGRPLLSVLIVTHLGRPLPYLDEVLRRLGVAEPVSKFALQQWAAVEVNKTQAAYGAQRTRREQVAPPRAAKQPVAKVHLPSANDLQHATRRRAEMREKVEEAARTRARTKGARVQRLSEAINQAEVHLRRCEKAHADGRALRSWLVESDRILDLLGRLIGRPITIITTRRDQGTAPADPKPVKAAEPKPAEKKDPHLRQIRRTLGELERTNRHRPTKDLLRLLDEIGTHREQLARPLPAPEAKRVEHWRTKLEERRSTERSAEKAASRNAPTKAGRSAETPREPRLPADKIDKLAHTVREILQELARADGSPLSWGDLRLRARGQFPFLHPDDQVALLVAVDRSTPADEPLLSTLVDSSVVAPHRLYRQVRLGLGRKPVPDTELEAHRAMEALRLRGLWRYRR